MGIPASIVLVCLLVSVLMTGGAFAGWDLSNQRQTDGQETVAGVLTSSGEEPAPEEQGPVPDDSSAQGDSDEGDVSLARGNGR